MTKPRSVELGSRVERHIGRFVEAGETDAMAVAVAFGGEPRGAWYCGQAQPGMPADQDTLWPLASISKLYTAAAIMALVEEGVVTLRTRVAEVLPEFGGGEREGITLWHLLTHTSGVIYESPAMVDRLRARTPMLDLLAEIREHGLLFPPGTKHNYSDLGFALAGHTAAVAAGSTFPELVRTRVLEPAELRETLMPPTTSVDSRIAYVTGAQAEGTDGAMYNSRYARSLAHPAFGTVASLSDLLRFGLLFAPGVTDRLLSHATVRAMTTNQLGSHIVAHGTSPDEALPMSWGLGFAVHEQRDPFGASGDLVTHGSYSHGGASGCMLLVDPLHDVVIAIVGNRHAATGFERFAYRLGSTINVVMAAITG